MATNLPVSLTGFVGRERELNELGRLLRQTRLVTLTGPGGCGKTRLAVEVARPLVDEHPGAAFFVDLSTVTGHGLVVSAIASAVGLASTAGPDLSALIRGLTQRDAVLVADNCEHLAEEVACVAVELLHSCPRLRLLATSREPLGVEGERVYRVGSLPEPDAVRLFGDRAQQADATFRLDETNKPTVAAICGRLDRMPLPVELAAACVGSLAPGEILQRLDQRFRLLVGGRSAIARHRTLRATVDWSEALLSEDERRLFRRLGVFVGGFDLEAAEAVVSGPDLPADEVLPLLRRLVERSLVEFEPRQDVGRYRLLETIREHALERLVAAGEAQWVRDAHAAHFTAVAWQQARQTPKFDYPDWPLLHRELGNFRASLEHAHATGSHGFAQLAACLMPFWSVLALDEGRRWMEAALATEPEDLYVRSRLAWGLGVQTIAQGDLDAARQYNRQALDLFEERSDDVETARVLANMAAVELAAKDAQAGLQLARRAELRARQTGDLGVLRLALLNLASAQLQMEDLDGALAAAEQSVTVSAQLREPARLRQSLNLLVGVHLDRGEVDTGLALQRDAIQRDQPSVRYDLDSLANMARLLSVSGHPASGLRLAGAVEAHRERLGFSPSSLDAPLAIAMKALGPRAASVYESGRRMSIQEAKAFALQGPGQAPASDFRLTRREVEVARLVRQGLTDPQIAKRLFISKRTAEGHVESLRNKLGVGSRAEVAAWIAENLPMEQPAAERR